MTFKIFYVIIWMRPILSMGSDKMIRSMASRARRITPLNETELKIICSATKLFLENGFSKTTFTMISKDSGVLKGNIAYYFHAKEDMLFLLVQELMDFHGEIIEAVDEHSHSHLLAYALEITSQIALCETNEAARDLYYSAYNHPGTFEYIKDWTAKKNYRIFKSLHPDWTEHEFRVREHIASHMEFSALTSPCDKDFTDGELCVKYAKEQGIDEIILLAMTSERLDHTLSNIMMMSEFANSKIVDEANEIYFLRDRLTIENKKGKTLSIIPVNGDMKGITTQGLLYPLHNETLYFGECRGNSNVITEDKCEIRVQKGMGLAVLVI